MKVKVAKRVYQMSSKEAAGMLELASEQVPHGIYALRFRDYIELRNDHMSSTQVKAAKRRYRQQGVKVYANL